VHIRFIGFGLVGILSAGMMAAKTPALPRDRAGEADFVFQVCVVDEAQPEDSPERAALRARIVKCFQQTIGEGWRELRDEKVETKLAVRRMKAGECDAVIFFGPKRPRKLRRLDTVTFAVDLGRERKFEPVYLIVPAREVQLQRTILANFPKALAPLHPSTVMMAAR
jgi:hypothetical protein